MSWERVTDDGRLTEWKRSDDTATIRLRELPGERWTVRFDRMYQAPEGTAYRREAVESREEAMELIEEWQTTFDVSDA